VKADWALETTTRYSYCEFVTKKCGTKNDFFSEADYFWPDSLKSRRPIREPRWHDQPGYLLIIGRDVSFQQSHRITGISLHPYRKKTNMLKHAMLSFESMVCKRRHTDESKYGIRSAIKGRVTGRGYGIIDTIHLMEVAQGR